MNSGSPVPSTVRTIYQAHWYQEHQDPKKVRFEIQGNGFLKQMVRNIVGTFLHMHVKDMRLEDLDRILKAKDRREAFKSAPAHGLYLRSVNYPEIDSKSLKSLNY